MTIRAAVIGASFAKEAYLPALATIPDVELVAISSARLESAKAVADKFNIPNAYDNWKVMLEKHQVDLVGIATPTIYHAPMVLAALEAGAHVICEKPMAMNSNESLLMLEKATALNRVHMIGHELRFNPNRRKIHQLIKDGVIGQIRHANVSVIGSSWGNPASQAADSWLAKVEMGGGRLGANGSHQLDLLRFWLGDINAVSGQVVTMVPDRTDKNNGAAFVATADDLTTFTAEMKSGAIAQVFISTVARNNMGNHVQIFGSEGTIKLTEGEEKLWLAKAGEDFVDVSESDPNANLPGIGKGIWNISFVALIQETTNAIREGRGVTWGATFADGFKTQQAMDAIRLSSQERRWVDL
ncbi:MAG: Gfo/Idh/MocA family oxidoreductase [Anaerolineae bacterium]|nr:Gfo/Idh/MocA family oxidoreductase [Anaerolineae bacterium]